MARNRTKNHWYWELMIKELGYRKRTAILETDIGLWVIIGCMAFLDLSQLNLCVVVAFDD